MFKKIIIETEEGCSNFGILVITCPAGKNIGQLEIFNYKEGNGIRKIGVDDLEHDGWKQFAEKLALKAREVCKEYEAELWIY